MSEGFRGVPGVPDGWELVAIRKVRYMENYIWTSGYPSLWQDSEESDFVVPIIRKIEQPAKYRAFANASEADQFWNAALRFRNPHPRNENSRFRINTIGCDGITIGLEFYSYGAAFSKFCVDDDGTPFGVRVDD